ncbi:MAG TPA: energy-coupling factor transporter ATPase [Anaerolineales bacterium]|nr:energy-coupling factor transporter ATPase [Anaerolineales bacterium]HNB37516.1 energy-coupling factor transporter ATPase [Anaerolineales bacterium]HND93986.1 energy-coupling factor transporter ATPase [Anaerolineales bacterium]
MSNTHPQEIAETIIHLAGVTYHHYGKTVPALADINIDVKRGSFTLLVGPSGSGKSTLCMLLNGIIPQILGGELQGKVIVNGQDVAEAKVQNMAYSVGLLFQDPEWMFATLQVEDEVAFGPENLRQKPEEIAQQVTKSLEYVGMNNLRKNLVWALSGGQIQKLGLATVLAMAPEIIVLDEPTANLDPATTHSVHELILRLRDEGKTVILVTKDLDEFMARADDMILLSEGHILAQGRPQDVISQHGKIMLDLGVWLPEPTEAGLRLKQQGLLKNKPVPITVAEAVDAFKDIRFKQIPTIRKENPIGETLIHADKIQFGYTRKTKTLREVSFDINQGEIVAIVGQNGAGKSTLSKMLVGLLKPSAGALTMFGRKASQWNVQDLANDVALVFQNPEHQFLCDTVYEELAYSLLAQGITDSSEVEKRVNAMLERLDITDAAETHPFSLSAGSKRRLGVATMLVGGRAKLLIVDEPTYGQDRRLTERLMQLINNLRSEGITVIMITHDMRLVDAHVDRAIVMANGEKIFDGAPSNLFQSPEIVERASLRTTALRRVVDGLRAQGVQVPNGLNTVDSFVSAVENV